MTWMLSVTRSCLFIIFISLLKTIYGLIQQITWYINGIRASRDKTCYERSVHVQKVLWGKKLFHRQPSSSSEFMTSHVEFVHPHILLDPNISLYGLDKKEATFLKTKNNVDIFNSDTHPFMKWAQAAHSEMVYTIPLWAFNRFADEVDDPVLPVIWISSIGRCGSTLLGQVFEKLPGSVSLAEPDAITALTFLNKGAKISKQEARDLLRSVIRIQCRSLPGAQRIVLKTASETFAEVKDIYTMFPKIKHIFLYRKILPYAKSAQGLLNADSQAIALKMVLDWGSLLQNRMYIEQVRIDRDNHFLEDLASSLSFIGLRVMLAAAVIHRYMEFTDQGIPMFAILYDDLVAHKEELVTEMFRRLDIPEKYVLIGLTAFEKDSQRNSPLIKKERRELSPRDMSDINKILRRYGFPPCNVIIDVPNRISPPCHD